MKHLPIQIILLAFWSLSTSAQSGWTICKTPGLQSRVDDIYMVDGKVGYAACGDGKIIKTTDGGLNWANIQETKNLYCRSVEFFDTLTGFVGSFPINGNQTNILRKTVDGGKTWTDLSSLLDARALKGICGMALAGNATVYGCGNWFQDSAYIVKSTDGGNSWTFIDMKAYAGSLIDMIFINKDTGFVAGRSPLPLRASLILYTTNGGQTWTEVFKGTASNERIWKIQRITNQVYCAAVEGAVSKPSVLKSINGGETWNNITVTDTPYHIQGAGFINQNLGWAGGGLFHSYETRDGGMHWDSVRICPGLNRVFKVNDTLLFAAGFDIWKYTTTISTGLELAYKTPEVYSTIKCYPIPANDVLSIDINLLRSTHALLMLLDVKGNEVKMIDNTDKPAGKFSYRVQLSNLQPGMYYMLLKTHEDNQLVKVMISR